MPDFTAFSHATWFQLHSFAASYPIIPSDKDKENFKQYLQSLAEVYPCQNPCGAHIREYMKENAFEEHWNSKDEVEEYVYNLHQHANINAGKDMTKMPEFKEVQFVFRSSFFPSFLPSFKKYQLGGFKSAEESETLPNMNNFILAILIITVIFFVIIFIILMVICARLNTVLLLTSPRYVVNAKPITQQQQ